MEPPPKKRRGLWSLQQLQAAMAAVQGGLLSQRAAAARYSIPRRTLSNHLKSGKEEKQIGRRTILTADQENDLVSRIKRLASIGFPLTPKVIRNQAYVFCERHNIPNKFNQVTKRAGKDWLKLFLKRHPDISKRKVQILNPGRAQKLNKPIVMQHFEEYKKIYEELDIGNQPQRLYNMDEKGCRLTIHKQPLVLAQKGAKRVHMVAPEHAENVTVAACVNALGSAIPPMIIFKGKRMKPEFKDNLPAGSIVKMAPKGSMTSSLFIDFIHHLGKYKTIGKCLLVFDGASCHLDYNIVDAADEEDIILYCLPSNTTHELQPLDKSVNKSFEYHWDEETLLFLYQHPDKKLTKARFNTILNKVWSKCMTHQNIVSGFRATGLYPFDPDAIPIEAYAPSELTRRPSDQENVFAVNDLSHQKPPTPGSSGRNARRTVRIASTNSFDSNKTFFEDVNPDSPSLLQRNSLSPVSIGTGTGVNRRLVDYSSSSTESSKFYLSLEPSTSGAIVRRPIIYSSESDTSIFETLISSQKFNPPRSLNIYCLSDDENLGPLLKQKHTPNKQTNISTANIDVRTRKYDSSVTSSDDSEDGKPLVILKAHNCIKSPFQQLIPTPNFAVVKQKPRRKAMNYKAQIVTKDLFRERLIRKENKGKSKRETKENKPQQIGRKCKKQSHNMEEKVEKERLLKKKSKKKKEEDVQIKKLRAKTVSRVNNEASKINADDKWYCFACNTESCEDMRQCPVCQRWFHERCLGLTKDDVDFECPMCN